MRNRLAILVLLIAAFCGTRISHAVESSGITVTGNGEVNAKPNRLEIELVASGSAELTGDALKKYRDAMKRTLDAYKELDFKNVKVEQRGLKIDSVGAGQPLVARIAGGGNAPTKLQVGISGALRLELSGINELSEEALTDAISKLLDTAKDSGATVGKSNGAESMMAQIYGQQGGTSMVTYYIDNITELREKAYTAAFQEAQERAQRLAALAHRALGPVLAMEEIADAPAEETSIQSRMMAAMYGAAEGSSKHPTRVTSDKFAEIPVRVALRVRFAILESGNNK